MGEHNHALPAAAGCHQPCEDNEFDLAIFLAVIFGFLFCVSFWGFVIWKVFEGLR